MIKFGSLFSGIGGLDLGLERAGMQCVWQCENDDYASRVLRKHWPHVKNYGDITKAKWKEAKRPDLICGGFPCQPHSIAGSRLGESDERNLFPVAVHVIRRFRPVWVVLENVPGIFHTIFDKAISDLEREGYEVWPLVLGADLLGARHKRRRVFFVCTKTSEIPNAKRQRLSRYLQIDCFSVAAGPAFSEFGDSNARLWGSLDTPERHLPRSNGVPLGLVRRSVKALGNAVVPQVAELIGRAIVKAHQETHD